MTQPPTIGLVLLAAGLSTRFGEEDKLLADYKGRPLLAYPARLFEADPRFFRIAITDPNTQDKTTLLRAHKWKVIENSHPEKGQGSSLSTAIKHLQKTPNIETAIIILADMPNITENYLEQLIGNLTDSAIVVTSKYNKTTLPPVLLRRSTFKSLSKLDGDQGAKQFLKSVTQKITIDLPADMANDIDTITDIKRLSRAKET